MEFQRLRCGQWGVGRYSPPPLLPPHSPHLPSPPLTSPVLTCTQWTSFCQLWFDASWQLKCLICTISSGAHVGEVVFALKQVLPSRSYNAPNTRPSPPVSTHVRVREKEKKRKTEGVRNINVEKQKGFSWHDGMNEHGVSYRLNRVQWINKTIK